MKLTNSVLWIIILLSIALCFSWGYISADEPYYMGIARDISNAKVVYKDIMNSYTPIVMYIHAVFINPANYSYSTHLFIQFMMLAGIVALFFLSFKNKDKTNAWQTNLFLGAILFATILSSDGHYFNLEIPVLFFTMCSVLFLKKEKYLLAGAFFSLAFLCKQYAIFLFPTLLFAFYNFQSQPKKLFNKFFSFSIGSIAVLVLFLIYFNGIHGVHLNDLFIQLSGQGYGQKGLSSSKSILGYLLSAKIFILLLALALYVIIKHKTRLTGLFITSLVFALIPTLVQNFQHYFILGMLPIFLFLFANTKTVFFKNTFKLGGAFIVVISLLLLNARLYRYKSIKQEQEKLAIKYQEEYPKGAPVFILGNKRFLYLKNNYQNPLLQEFGYSFRVNKNDIKQYKDSIDVIYTNK